jgi:hypothetical protein
MARGDNLLALRTLVIDAGTRQEKRVPCRLVACGDEGDWDKPLDDALSTPVIRVHDYWCAVVLIDALSILPRSPSIAANRDRVGVIAGRASRTRCSRRTWRHVVSMHGGCPCVLKLPPRLGGHDT